MSRFLIRRTAALFVLSILLAAPWSAAEPQHARGAAPAQILSRLWSQWAILWSDIGCILDPNGACGGSAAGRVDIGCVIDPNGACGGNSAPSQVDIGCGLDPSGGCGR